MQTSQRPAPSQWLSVEGRDQKMHVLEAHTQETNASVQLGPAPPLQPRTMPPLEVEGSGASLHPASTQAQTVSLERSPPHVEKTWMWEMLVVVERGAGLMPGRCATDLWRMQHLRPVSGRGSRQLSKVSSLRRAWIPPAQQTPGGHLQGPQANTMGCQHRRRQVNDLLARSAKNRP